MGTVLNRHVEWPSKDGCIAICNMTDSHINYTINNLMFFAQDRTNSYVNGMDTNVSYTGFTIREWIHALQREQRQRKREVKKARSSVFGMAANKKNSKRRKK